VIFWLGFSAGALFMFLVLFTFALMATAKDADRALERYAEDWRADRELHVVRSLDLPIPPKDCA
jgi:hypothetical protein